MRVLRLGNSYDIDPNIATGENKVSVADRILEEAAGEPIETTSRVIWPDAGLPDLVEKWVKRYEPELVLLVVSSYWFTYVSVPVRLERRFGRFGRPLAKAGWRMAEKPWLAHNGVFRAARRAAISSIGGATNFSPDEVVERMEACIRKLVAHEDIALVVRGPRVAFAAEGTRAAWEWAERRRADVDRRMAALCGQLHVEYIQFAVGASAQAAPEEFQGDLVHATSSVHADQGRLEGEAMLRAWRQVRGLD